VTARRTLQERLAAQPMLAGLLQTHPNPTFTEMVGMCGYDFLILDDEHGVFSQSDHLNAMRALSATDVAVFVRLSGHDFRAIGRYLDMGADGLVIPNVETAEQASALVRAALYPPAGTRGVGAPAHRATRYGLSFAAHLRAPRAGAALVVLIESALGVANIDAILNTDGIDAALVGPADLAANLGCIGDYSHSAYADAMLRVEQIGTARGKVFGTAPHAGYPIEALLDRGHRLLILGADTPLMRDTMCAQVAKARTTERAARQSAPGTSPTVTEPVLEPDLPIVDAHHHLWLLSEKRLCAVAEANSTVRALATNFRRHARYLLDEFVADVDSGHNIRASVFVDAQAMYRSSGPPEMQSTGEVEFANGVAAAAASGLFGATQVCAGIIGHVDLTLGDAVEDVLRAHLLAGGQRYRGIRCKGLVYDEDPSILGAGVGTPQLLSDARFRAGFKWLQPLGLSFDAWLLEPQLPELLDLACAFPETQIVINHVGAPVGVGRYAGRREERYPSWLAHMRALSRCPNVAVKLGGLGIPFGGFASFGANPPATSEQLAAEWRTYIEPCIDIFGVERCMFESNFPVDAATCSYPVLWNAFKRITSGASIEEKTALYAGTATRIYRLNI
jgi:L-fuconolactonase